MNKTERKKLITKIHHGIFDLKSKLGDLSDDLYDLEHSD